MFDFWTAANFTPESHEEFVHNHTFSHVQPIAGCACSLVCVSTQSYDKCYKKHNYLCERRESQTSLFLITTCRVGFLVLLAVYVICGDKIRYGHILQTHSRLQLSFWFLGLFLLGLNLKAMVFILRSFWTVLDLF